jgi:hypothetical protein
MNFSSFSSLDTLPQLRRLNARHTDIYWMKDGHARGAGLIDLLELTAGRVVRDLIIKEETRLTLQCT